MKKALLVSLLSLSFGSLAVSAAEPELVDMGTVSAIWAKDNLGVDSDYPDGKYYLFGAPAPYTGPGTGESYFAGKYPAAGNYYGDAEYDAATAAYGDKWITPTADMFSELYDACTVEAVVEQIDALNSILVYVFTSKTTGNQIKFRTGYYWMYGQDAPSTFDPQRYFQTSTSYGGGRSAMACMDYTSTATFYQWEFMSRAYRLRPVYLTGQTVKVTSITLDNSQLSLYKGMGSSLTASVLPSYAADRSVTWKSSDESVATVSSSGYVTAVAEGVCEISVTANDTGNISAKCKVTVSKQEEQNPDAQYVDMGTSVLWAKENLGVSDEYPYGAYYQIGAIEPFTGAGTGDSWLTANPITGAEDQTYAGNPEADAATAVLGKGWCTPTQEQIDELAKACTASCEQDPATGKYVLTLKSRTTGNELKFVYAGYMTKSSDYTSYDYLCLLSSTVYPQRNGYLVKTKAPSTSLETTYSFMATSGQYYYNIRPVMEKPVQVENIALDIEKLSMSVGDTRTISATVTPEKAEQTLSWSSSDEAIATVDASGIVTALAEGTCVITATATDGSGVKAECALTVYKVHIQEGMSFIDMGTSVMWASQPLGTDDEHPYGNLYKFGATEPYPASSSLWTLEDSEWGGNENCDAATVALGTGVSTPSMAQFLELFEVCDFTYSRNYSLGRDQLTLTSKVTGNKLVITGAGYWSFSNDHSDDASLYLISSTCEDGSTSTCYYFSGTAASSKGLENSMMRRNSAESYAYQILPVFKAEEAVKATDIRLNATELSIQQGETATLSAIIEPENVSVTEVVWSASNEAVATVDAEGVVTAIAPGECTVTATTTDATDLSASCVITVIAPTPEMKSVDLGLSVLWGECEIGAADYFEAGTYYAWGTVENANNWEAAIPSAYKPVNTSTAVTAVSRDEADPTKAYDVAKEVLGDQWHTPNFDEWNEMINNCDLTWETVNDQRRLCFTSKINGNSIYFTGHGYMRSTSSEPLMSSSILLQTSDGANSNIYAAIYMVPPKVEELERYCYWLLPIRPVYGDNLASIGSVTVDNDTAGLFDVYDISGRLLIRSVEYSDACSRLNSGIYLFVSPDGRRLKVSL